MNLPVVFREPTILCLLNCVTENIQVLEGRMLGSSALDRAAAGIGMCVCVCVWCECVCECLCV